MKLITSQSLLNDINPLISLLLASTRAFELPYFKISCLYKKVKKAYFLNVSKNQVRLEVGNKTLKPLDRGECKITAAHSTFVARSVVGTENLVI